MLLTCLRLKKPPIKIPTTFIKSPGLLVSSFNSFSSVEDLLSLIEDLKLNFELQRPQSSQQKSGKYSLEELSISPAIQKYSESPIAEPGKIKQFSDELSKLISIAQKVLSRYEIKLIVSVDMSNKRSKTILTTLQFIIPEVTYFSVQFFKDLGVKEFVLCEEEPSENLWSCPDRLHFPLSLIDNQSKVQQIFYTFIFNSLISKETNFVQEWKMINQENDILTNQSQMIEDLKRTFISLMSSYKKDTKNENMLMLMKMLAKYFPELSEEWFQTRIVAKKKNTKVTFNLDS